MREWQRAVALAEATEMQEQMNAEREARNAKRDVLEEAKRQKGPSKPEEKPKEGPSKPEEKPKATPPKSSDSKPKDEDLNKARNRKKKIDSIIDAAVHGIKEADEANGVQRK
jgi:outer membrane biosynthesis protein TonB